MPSQYANYVRFYLLMDYSRDDSEFYALLETNDLWERPEPKKPSNNADKEIPEKEDATIPEPEALDEQCKTNKKVQNANDEEDHTLQSMGQNVSDEEDGTWGNWTAQGKSQQAPSQAQVQNASDEEDHTLQSMGQNVSDEEDDTWGNWTAQGKSQQAPSQAQVQNASDEEDDTWGNWTAQDKSQQAPSQAPTTSPRRAESDSQERSKRITRRIQMLLTSGYKCFSQACCQAESMIVSRIWLTNIDLDKIKAECKDECCNPAGSSASATSSASLRWINAPIPEAATEHSEIRRLLNLADENSKSSEAATEHSEIPEAACQEAKRPRKSGKGSFSGTQKIFFPDTNAKTITQACEH